VLALLTGEAAVWCGDGVMVRVVRVIDAQPGYLARGGVPGDHIQVDVPVLVLQEGVVEVGRGVSLASAQRLPGPVGV
jgi:hypothetical protein